MKSKSLAVLSVVLLIAAIVFACLWIHERNDRSDWKQTAQIEAGAAYDSFVEYQTHAHESSYRQAAASFYAFKQAYYRYTEDADKSYNYDVSNELYGFMVISPEKCQSHIAEITDIVKLLAENVDDENAYLLMAGLSAVMSE